MIDVCWRKACSHSNFAVLHVKKNSLKRRVQHRIAQETVITRRKHFLQIVLRLFKSCCLCPAPTTRADCSNYNPLQLQPEEIESENRTSLQLSSEFQRQSVCCSAPTSCICKLHFLWWSLMAALALSLHPHEDPHLTTLCRCHPAQILIRCTQESCLAATDRRFFHGHTC